MKSVTSRLERLEKLLLSNDEDLLITILPNGEISTAEKEHVSIADRMHATPDLRHDILKMENLLRAAHSILLQMMMALPQSQMRDDAFAVYNEIGNLLGSRGASLKEKENGSVNRNVA